MPELFVAQAASSVTSTELDKYRLDVVQEEVVCNGNNKILSNAQRLKHHGAFCLAALFG